MPSKKQYDLVLEDGLDSKTSLYSEDSFQQGINFQAKYIGTMDVPRPSSRVEIVAAMRRIRYEFKAKAVKKRKVQITVSVDGVKVMLQRKNKKKQQWIVDESQNILLEHPIYRIFYVSHDSQDLKIYSYIARDGTTNVFKCNVFKAYKKSQAMQIVRTIGQAFEVCHRISLQTAARNEEGNEAGSEKSSEENSQTAMQSSSTLEKPAMLSSPSDNETSANTQSPGEPPVDLNMQHCNNNNGSELKHLMALGTISFPTLPPLCDETPNGDIPTSTYHRIKLLQQQMELQTQQMQFALSQLQLLKDQLAAETAARLEAQARAQQLMIQNRELVDHVDALLKELTKLELPGSDVTTSDLKLYSQERLTKDSPDSGHKEMSSDSLSGINLCQSESWYTPTGDDAKNNNSSFRSTRTDLSFSHSNGYNKNLSANGNSWKDSTKVITPLPLQDASGNRIEFTALPRLNPPPKVWRNSTRAGPLISSLEAPVLNNPSVTVASNRPTSFQLSVNPTEKRYSWESYQLKDKFSEPAVNTLPPKWCKEEPPRQKGQVNELENDSSSVNTQDKVLRFEKMFGIAPNKDSADSTAKLELSFSDDD